MNGNSETLVRIITKLLQELRPGAAQPSVQLTSDLEKDLGVDSLGRAELLMRIENQFGVSLPDIVLGTARTVKDLLQFIESAPKIKKEFVIESPSEKPERVFSSEPTSAQTLLDVLEFHASQTPNGIFIRYLESDNTISELTFKGLCERAKFLGSGIIDRGLPANTPVAIMLPTGLEFFYAFFGCLYAGAIPVPLYPPDRPSQIEDYVKRQASILKNSQARLLITIPEGRTLAKLFGSISKDLEHVHTPDELMLISPALHFPKIHDTDIAFLQYTSGSTGDPKGVMLSHANLLANIRAMGLAVGATCRDVFVSWLPLYHDMGLIGACLGSLYYGSELVLMSPLNFLAHPANWLSAIHRYRGTISAAPNFAYEICASRIAEEEIKNLNLNSWRMAFSGAEPVSAETIKKFSKRFAPYGFKHKAWMPVYGLAECSLGLTFQIPGKEPQLDCVSRKTLIAEQRAVNTSPEKADALELVGCGVPVFRHEVRIVNNQGLELKEREIGHIHFRGPSATSGYYHNSKATQKLFHPPSDKGLPWLDTGDLGYFAGGQLFITGRNKDLIIRAGSHLFPEEIEEQIGQVHDVRKGCVAVFGVADERTGTEKIVVVAETRISGKEIHEDLKKQINQVCALKLGMTPDEIVITPPRSVLKTSSGKIRRNATKEAYINGTLGHTPSRWLQWIHLFRLGILPAINSLTKRARIFLYGGYAWLVASIALTCGVIGVFLLPRRSWRIHFSSIVLRALLFMLRIRLTIRGRENLTSIGHRIFVCNHASYLDSLILIAALPEDYHFVVKKEFESHFLMGPFMRRLGCLFVERFDAQKAVESARDIDHALHTGASVMIFPEGTFSRQTGLRPFHVGAFLAAARENVAVIPIVINGSREILRSDQWWPRHSTLTVTIFPPITPKATDWSAAIALRDEVKAKILSACGEPELW